MSLSYMVIHPCGDRSKLCVAQVRDYQQAEWALASRRRFDTEAEAKDYARDLARDHGLRTTFDQHTLDDT